MKWKILDYWKHTNSSHKKLCCNSFCFSLPSRIISYMTMAKAQKTSRALFNKTDIFTAGKNSTYAICCRERRKKGVRAVSLKNRAMTKRTRRPEVFDRMSLPLVGFLKRDNVRLPFVNPLSNGDWARAICQHQACQDFVGQNCRIIIRMKLRARGAQNGETWIRANKNVWGFVFLISRDCGGTKKRVNARPLI